MKTFTLRSPRLGGEISKAFFKVSDFELGILIRYQEVTHEI